MSHELNEKRVKLVADARAILAKSDATSEDVARANKMMDDSDAIKTQIDAAFRAEKAEKELRAAPPAIRQGINKSQSADPVERAEQEKRAWLDYARNGELKMSTESREILSTRESEQRANEFIAGTGSAGGYFVPTLLANEYESAKKYYGPMLKTSKSIRTASGALLNWPTSTDVSNTGAIVGEAASVGSNVASTLAQTQFSAYKFSSKLVQVSRELLEDSAFDFGSYLAGILGERIGRIQNTKFTVGAGSGSSEPNGIVTAVYATAGNRNVLANATSQVTTVTMDSLLTTVYQIDPAYRQNCSWMFSNNTAKKIRQLKVNYGTQSGVDSNNYLWQPSVIAGQPDLLHGYPVFINPDMADMAANAKSIIFGDLSSYIIRNVGTPRFVRDESYGLGTDVTTFIAFDRADGNSPTAAFGPCAIVVNAAS